MCLFSQRPPLRRRSQHGGEMRIIYWIDEPLVIPQTPKSGSGYCQRRDSLVVGAGNFS